MGIPFERFMDRFTAEERAEIDAHADRLIAEEMSLRELRKALGKTQAQLARKLRKPQASVSRIEQQSDMLISTLDDVVRALGGRVRILAELPGRAPLYLTGLTTLMTSRQKGGPQRQRANGERRKSGAKARARS